MENNIAKKIEGFEDALGPYEVQSYDAYSGEPVAWGFKIIKRLGEDRFNELREKAELECVYPDWFVVSKKLTREEAIQLYGPVTHEEFGPRGGWKYIEFGDKRFGYNNLR